MAKKDKKAATKPAASNEEKLAKKKARMEALKNRPAGQRPNSKQVDVIDLGDGNVIKNFGYPIKQKNLHIGVLVTSVALKNGEVTSTSVSFIPGDLTVKSKKDHGTITGAKYKGTKENEVDEEEDDDSSED